MAASICCVQLCFLHKAEQGRLGHFRAASRCKLACQAGCSSCQPVCFWGTQACHQSGLVTCMMGVFSHAERSALQVWRAKSRASDSLEGDQLPPSQNQPRSSCKEHHNT